MYYIHVTLNFYKRPTQRANTDINHIIWMSVKSHNRACILVQVTIHRGLRTGRDGHLDQSEAYTGL